MWTPNGHRIVQKRAKVQFIKLMQSKPLLIQDQSRVQGTRHFRLAKFPDISHHAVSSEQLIKRLEETARQKQLDQETARSAEQSKTEAFVRKSRQLLNDPSTLLLKADSPEKASTGSYVDPFYQLKGPRKNAIEFVQ